MKDRHAFVFAMIPVPETFTFGAIAPHFAARAVPRFPRRWPLVLYLALFASMFIERGPSHEALTLGGGGDMQGVVYPFEVIDLQVLDAVSEQSHYTSEGGLRMNEMHVQ